jgi:hypothetical protein
MYSKCLIHYLIIDLCIVTMNKSTTKGRTCNLKKLGLELEQHFAHLHIAAYEM